MFRAAETRCTLGGEIGRRSKQVLGLIFAAGFVTARRNVAARRKNGRASGASSVRALCPLGKIFVGVFRSAAALLTAADAEPLS